MAGITGTEDISLSKEDVLESKQFASTARKIIFAHKATGGETGINLLSLVTPPELASSGFVQPSTAEIASSRLLFNKKNFRLISSANGELWMHDHYVITSEGFISFLNGITALPGEIFRGEIIDVPQTAIITADARSITRTFQLGVGVTLLNLGVLYKVGDNLTAGSQVGSIKVWRNGQLQMRNVGNAMASPSADGNYQEYDPANIGTSNQIQFNVAPSGQSDEIIVEFGLHVFSGDIEIYGVMEQLHGILFKLAQDSAVAFGNPLSNYLSANPSQVDRRQFGDLVVQLGIDVGFLQKLGTTIISAGSSGGASTGGTSMVDVTNMVVDVPNDRADSIWEIGFQSDGSGNDSAVGIGGGSSTDNSCLLQLLRNGVVIANYQIKNFQGTAGGYNYEPTSAVRFKDINPPVGTNQYKLQFRTAVGTGASAVFHFAKMFATRVHR